MIDIISLKSVDSTNDYAKKRIESGCYRSSFAVVAEEQSAGRGRYGKTFYSPAGCGVYLSYVFECGYALETMQQITMVAAALIHQVLQSYSEDLSIKWVNDIMRGNRKIAGILTERVDKADSDSYFIIIGVGINVLSCKVPAEFAEIIGFLCEAGTDATLISEITTKLIGRFESTFTACDSFDTLIKYYREHCRNLPSEFCNELLNQ